MKKKLKNKDLEKVSGGMRCGNPTQGQQGPPPCGGQGQTGNGETQQGIVIIVGENGGSGESQTPGGTINPTGAKR